MDHRREVEEVTVPFATHLDVVVAVVTVVRRQDVVHRAAATTTKIVERHVDHHQVVVATTTEEATVVALAMHTQLRLLVSVRHVVLTRTPATHIGIRMRHLRAMRMHHLHAIRMRHLRAIRTVTALPLLTPMVVAVVAHVPHAVATRTALTMPTRLRRATVPLLVPLPVPMIATVTRVAVRRRTPLRRHREHRAATRPTTMTRVPLKLLLLEHTCVTQATVPVHRHTTPVAVVVAVALPVATVSRVVVAVVVLLVTVLIRERMGMCMAHDDRCPVDCAIALERLCLVFRVDRI